MDMETTAYARRFRRIGVVSALAAPILIVAMRIAGLTSNVWYLGGIALALATVPLLLFAGRNKPVCQKCGGAMRIDAGFPRMIYRCRSCGDLVHTGLHADY